MLTLVAAVGGGSTVAAELAVADELIGREDLHLGQVRFEVRFAHLSLYPADLLEHVAQTLRGDCPGGEQLIKFSLLVDKCAA